MSPFEELTRLVQTRLRRLELNALDIRQGVVTAASPLAVAVSGSPTPRVGIATLERCLLVGDVVKVLRSATTRSCSAALPLGSGTAAGTPRSRRRVTSRR